MRIISRPLLRKLQTLSNLKANMTSIPKAAMSQPNFKGPVTVPSIPMNIKQQMMSFVSKFDEYVSNLIDYRISSAKARYERFDIGVEGKHAAILEGLDPEEIMINSDPATNNNNNNINDNNNNNDELPIPRRSGVVDIFSSRLYKAPDERRKSQAYSNLQRVFFQREKKYGHDNNFYDLIQSQERLPIRSSKNKIIDALRSNQVIVIAGETGSGKSTQVPQFILENFSNLDNRSNNFVNIAITQPRRISAISLAERVAVELGETNAGLTVGHNVRFDSKQPNRELNIMTFFTTGMLLRKLQQNSDLKGVTHLIIDEVHERDCTTDFLLILTKRILAKRRDLRVILMSASMDAGLFAKYFNNCPIISVSGRCFPVKDCFLNDVCQELRVQNPRVELRERAPKLDVYLLAKLIRHIDDTRGPGAVLCFMPGWAEMKAMQKELESCQTRNRLKILLVHSKLPIKEQRLIFNKTQPNERKIILATNIAETSITVNDVCFVIDTGLCNSIDYDPELNMSTFGTRWISRANAKQRSGRAGRTCPGECFKLYTREEESHFQDFPFPELLRIPLESVIMEAKSHCPNEKAASFLSQAVQHPSVSAIHNAIDELMLLGVLDPNESLTVLGRRIADFPTHPRLSVSLVISSALRCLYPVLNISAILSATQEPFLTALTDKAQIRKVKQRLCIEAMGPNREPIDFMSDHIACANLLAQYDDASMSKYEQDYFVRENNLNKQAMVNIKECRNLYARMMISAKFATTYDWYSYDSLLNSNMHELDLVVASLAHAFHPKVVRIIKGLLKNGKVYPNKAASTDCYSNTRVRFSSDSIVRNISLGKQLNSLVREGAESDEDGDFMTGEIFEHKRPAFLTYLNSRLDQESGLIVIKDGSVVPPLTLLLFGGRELKVTETHSKSSFQSEADQMTVTLDRYNLLSFKLSREDAQVIQDWRGVLNKYLDWYIHTRNTSMALDSNDSIIGKTMNEFLELNQKLYASAR